MVGDTVEGTMLPSKAKTGALSVKKLLPGIRLAAHFRDVRAPVTKARVLRQGLLETVQAKKMMRIEYRLLLLSISTRLYASKEGNRAPIVRMKITNYVTFLWSSVPNPSATTRWICRLLRVQ